MARLRDPERTRERLVQAALREIYVSGFQSTGLNSTLASAGITKGSLYYRFKSKGPLGHVVAEEIIARNSHGKWVRPLQSVVDPVDALIGAVQGALVRIEDMRGGCQLNSLAMEMSPLDARFRKLLTIVCDASRAALAASLRQGQTYRRVRGDGEPADATGLLISMVESYGSLVKDAQEPKVMKAGIINIADWVWSLRPLATASGSDHIGSNLPYIPTGCG